MTLEELQAKLRQLNADAQAIMDKAEAEKRDLTEEETAKVDELLKAFDETQAAIDAKQATANRRQRLADAGKALEESPGRSTASASPRVEPQPRTPDTAGFADLGEFATAVRCAMNPAGRDVDDRLFNIQGAPSNFHREGGSTEGYMVPPAFRQTIWDMVFSEPDLLNMVDSEPTGSNSVEFLADETTPWGSTGIQAHWAGEGTKFQPSRLETEARQVKLHKLYAFVTATEELLEDAPRLNARLTSGASRAIRWKLNESIVYGTGAGQPKGYFNSNALVSVAKESSQSADTIVAANVAKMFSRSLNPGRSVWMANSDILPQLMTMTLDGNLLWTPPSSGFQNAPGGFLFGRPIMFSEQCKTLGDKGDLQLIDPMGYYAPTKRGGPKFDSSIHLYFDYDIMAFRWTFRAGGQPYLSAPVSPNNGSQTKSHFVVLDERA